MMAEKVVADQVCIDPKWKWGLCQIGDVQMPFITLVHPVHGMITALVPPSVLKTMSDDFAKLADAGGVDGSR